MQWRVGEVWARSLNVPGRIVRPQLIVPFVNRHFVASGTLVSHDQLFHPAPRLVCNISPASMSSLRTL
jgi:hypothetical protein